MHRSRMKCLWLIIFMCSQMAAAQENLTKSELASLIQQLAGSPKKPWLAHGSIRSVHTRYRAPGVQNEEEILAMIARRTEDYRNNPEKAQKTGSLQAKFLEAIPFNVRYDCQNESTTVTTEHLKVDGEKFHQETSIDSHVDSIIATPLQAENHFNNQWNLETNRQRAYSYDGKRYIRYIKSADFALIEDSLGEPRTPKILRAGLIPWGTGSLAEEMILRSTPSARTQWTNGKELIHLEFHHEVGSVAATLDPSKSLATLDCTITEDHGAKVSHFFLSEYVRLGAQWAPTSILVEQHVLENDQYRLLQSDHWQLEIFKSANLGAAEFTPEFEDDTLINYISPMAQDPLQYRFRHDADTGRLLTQRLLALADNRPQNCASVAIEYIAHKLGKTLSVPPSTLIDYAGMSTLYDMQQYLRNQGLFAKAIKTSVDALPSHEDCFSVIYLPHINHYLLIERVDEDNVWALDLTSNNFYMSYPRDAFQREWRDGIALLVSNRWITTPEESLSRFESRTTSGGDGLQCTELVQAYGEIPCTLSPNWTCSGYREIFLPYWQCAPAPFGECHNNVQVLDRVRNLCEGTARTAGMCDLAPEMYFFLDWACQGTLPP